MKKILYVLIIAIVGGLTGCSLYSNFERPNVSNLHELYEADTTYTRLATYSWREFFTDTLLQKYIERGLEYNIDMRNARLNIVQAEATLEAARMAFLPSVNASLQSTLSGGNGDGGTGEKTCRSGRRYVLHGRDAGRGVGETGTSGSQRNAGSGGAVF